MRCAAIVSLSIGTACIGGGDPLPLAPLPALIASAPDDLATDVPVTAWVSLEFAGPVAPQLRGNIDLECEGYRPSATFESAGERRVVINPVEELPPSTTCLVQWPGPAGTVVRAFRTASAGEPGRALYDRDDARRTAPFPDDVWLVEDSTTRTGFRVEIPTPTGDAETSIVIGSFSAALGDVDGFSPLAPVIVDLDNRPDPRSLPLTTGASLDPLSTVALFDADPDSPAFRQRVPFHLEARTEQSPDGSDQHNLILFPAQPLRPMGRYVLAVTRRVFAEPSRPLAPSDYFAAALSGDADSAEQERAALVAGETADFLASTSPPIHRDDLALALRFSIRSIDDFADDLLAVRRLVAQMPTPSYQIDSVTPASTPGVAAVVRGSWEAPVWGDGGLMMLRDGAGKPRYDGTRMIPFVLALPESAVTDPAPMTMYQHGTPGSAEEIWSTAGVLGPIGQAVIGFTDYNNRYDDGSILGVASFEHIVLETEMPESLSTISTAEQIAFLRFMSALGDLDVLPLDGPDGSPDLDLSAPWTYYGISMGSMRGVGFLPYAPEISAAVLVVGGGRVSSVLFHQSDSALEEFARVFPTMKTTDIYVSLAMVQQLFDPQDFLHHARYLYAEPHDLGAGGKRASVLLIEGLGDSMTAPHSTQATAHALGLPHLAPVHIEVPFLQPVEGPQTANLGPDTTGAFYQYVPDGFPGLEATPSCELQHQSEGHFCPQSASEAHAQYREFIASAVTDGVPTVIDPLSLPAARWPSAPEWTVAPAITSVRGRVSGD